MTTRNTPAALAAAAAGDMANFIVASTPGGIERQEAQGQLDMIEALRLPRHITTAGVTWDKLVEQWGISYKPSDDELFHDVTLPTGWQLVATGHSMWSDLIDDRGGTRASVFYKAAFYDRRADMRLNRRYVVEYFVERDADEKPTTCGYRIKDAAGDTVIETIGTAPYLDFQAHDKLRADADKRIAELYPEHADPFAYWNE